MILFASLQNRLIIKQMWQNCFGDSDEFIDFFFRHKYNDQNTLIYFVEDKAVACLQMLPYSISFYGKELPFYYIAGACTLPEHRKQGYMHILLLKAFEVMEERGIPLSILIPGGADLYGFYAKYGYETVFAKENEQIEIRTIIEKYPNNLSGAHLEFKESYLNNDFCVQHDLPDFEAIVEENIKENFCKKTNLDGMAKIIDVQYLLTLFARKKSSKNFKICVIDELQNSKECYLVRDGICLPTNEPADISVNTNLLCHLLFGYKLSELDARYTSYFEEHHPTMSCMLE